MRLDLKVYGAIRGEQENVGIEGVYKRIVDVRRKILFVRRGWNNNIRRVTIFAALDKLDNLI